MRAPRYKAAWIWLAIAALALTYVARAQAGIEHARSCTSPIIEFLAGHQPSRLATAPDGARLGDYRTCRDGHLVLFQDSGSTVWTSVLPILFIGLLFPLALLSPVGLRQIGGIPPAPSLPSAFQRPPPANL